MSHTTGVPIYEPSRLEKLDQRDIFDSLSQSKSKFRDDLWTPSDFDLTPSDLYGTNWGPKQSAASNEMNILITIRCQILAMTHTGTYFSLSNLLRHQRPPVLVVHNVVILEYISLPLDRLRTLHNPEYISPTD